MTANAAALRLLLGADGPFASDVEDDALCAVLGRPFASDVEEDALSAVLAFVEFASEDDRPSVGNATVVVDVDVLAPPGTCCTLSFVSFVELSTSP